MIYIVNPIQRSKINRLRVFCFFQWNPCHSNKDAAAALDLTEVTVGKHARAIREGWRPEPQAISDMVDCDKCGPVRAVDQAHCPMRNCGVKCDAERA